MSDDNLDSVLDEMDADCVTFPLRGHSFTVPAPTAWPDSVHEALQTNDIVAIARILLGDQYDQFAVITNGRVAAAMNKLMPRVFGASVGESPGSSTS